MTDKKPANLFLKISSVLLSLVLLTACGNAWQKHYDLGMKYLSDGNYEEAIIEFEAAIEIDDKNPDTYIGLAEVYIQQGDLKKAIEILEAGYEKTQQDDSIKKKLKETYFSYADATIRKGKFKKAKSILEDASEEISADEEIKAKLDEMENNHFVDSDGNSYLYTYEYYPESKEGYAEVTFDSNGTAIFLEGKTTWYNVFEYTDGRKTKVTAYDENGNKLGGQKIVYDENGNVIKDFEFNLPEAVLTEWEKKYDNEGRLAETKGDKLYGLSGNAYKKKYIYKDNKIVREIYYCDSLESTELKKKCTTEYNYDEEGKLQKAIQKYVEGTESKITYSYDADGNQVSKRIYDNLYGVWEKGYYYTYEYDDSGNKISEKGFKTDGTLKYKITY